jgi:hypothetical protein
MQHIAGIRHLIVEFLHYTVRHTQLNTHLDKQIGTKILSHIELDTHK